LVILFCDYPLPSPLCPQAHSFELDLDTSGWEPYQRGGIVTQVKQAATLAFKPLAAALDAPGEFLLSDFSKMERSPLLHLAFQALDQYQVGGGWGRSSHGYQEQ
jgi:ubiquitin-activating enzyme E1